MQIKKVLEDQSAESRTRLEKDLWTFVSQKCGNQHQNTGEKMHILYEKLLDSTKLESPDPKKNPESKVSAATATGGNESEGKEKDEDQSLTAPEMKIPLKKRKLQPEADEEQPKKVKGESSDIRSFFQPAASS